MDRHTSFLTQAKGLWKAWNKGVYMFGAFGLGIIFAISHHCFHQHLNGTLVASSTQQQWYGRVSFGFALLVRFDFKITIGIAIAQMFWNTLKTKATKIGVADDILKVLNDPFTFRKSGIWGFSVPLVILALLSWFLPFATVVAPPTLGVANIPAVSRTTDYPVPQIDFDHGDGRRSFYQGTAPTDEAYSGPALELSRLALVTAGTGSILPIVAPWTNASYNLTFLGPSLKCQPLQIQFNESERQEINSSSLLYYVSGLMENSDPKEQILRTNNLTDPQRKSGNVEVPYAIPALTYSSISSATSRMLVYILGNADAIANGTALQECINYNSTYDVQFQYNNGQQSIEVRNISHSNEMPTMYNRSTLYPDCNDSISNHTECNQYNYITKSAAIFDALTYLLAGWIVEEPGGDGPNGFTPLFDTSLYFVKELENTRSIYGDARTPPELLHINNMTLIAGIEQLFQNITMSLFSRAAFLQETPSNLPVNIIEPVLVYSYEWMNLVIGYTLAAVFTLVTAGFGTWSITQNRSMYSNAMSTFIRVSRNEEMDMLVRDEDTDGRNPNPKYLEKTEVRLQEVAMGDNGRFALVVSGSSLNVDTSVTPRLANKQASKQNIHLLA